MSGPIVRKYGFPNFEKIFGGRGLQHGVDDEGKSAETAPAEGTANASTSEQKTEEGKKKSS